MKKSSKKKSNKTRLIILEGESDFTFFTKFKEKFNKKEFDICKLFKESQNFNKIKREISVSTDFFKYKKVWLVMDLKTRKPGFEKDYSTIEELIADYRQKIVKPGKVDYVIMVLDLECWLLLYFSDKKYKNTETIKNSRKELKKAMGSERSTGKTHTVKRLTQKTDFWEKLISNKDKNKSFRSFLHKAEITGIDSSL